MIFPLNIYELFGSTLFFILYLLQHFPETPLCAEISYSPASNFAVSFSYVESFLHSDQWRNCGLYVGCVPMHMHVCMCVYLYIYCHNKKQIHLDPEYLIKT